MSIKKGIINTARFSIILFINFAVGKPLFTILKQTTVSSSFGSLA